MDVLRQVAERAFIRRLADHLVAHHGDVLVECSSGPLPVTQLPGEILETLIEERVRRARSYGLTWQSSLAVFVTLTFVAAVDFDSFPTVRQVLLDDSLQPDWRLSELWDETSNHDWEQIKQGRNAKATSRRLEVDADA